MCFTYGNGISQAAGTCSRSLPITKYYVAVDGERLGSFEAPVGMAMINQVVELAVNQNRRLSVAIESCSSVVCRTSSSTRLSKCLCVCLSYF